MKQYCSFNKKVFFAVDSIFNVLVVPCTYTDYLIFYSKIWRLDACKDGIFDWSSSQATHNCYGTTEESISKNGNNRFVVSSYIVEKLELEEKCNSRLRCNEYHIFCVHEYRCTCPNNTINFNICKHIHALIHIMNFRQPEPADIEMNGHHFQRWCNTVNNGNIETTLVIVSPIKKVDNPRKIEILLGIYQKNNHALPQDIKLKLELLHWLDWNVEFPKFLQRHEKYKLKKTVEWKTAENRSCSNPNDRLRNTIHIRTRSRFSITK